METPPGSEKSPPPLTEVETLAKEFPDVPLEAILKEDLLRRGMAWSAGALEIAGNYKRKAYFIFSFDMAPGAELGEGQRTRAPEEVKA